MKKKIKKLSLPIVSSLLFAALVPTIVLTSCSTTSQWNLPIMIGGDGADSPWDGIDLSSYKDIPNAYQFSNPDPANNPNHEYYSPQSDLSYLPNTFISNTDPKAGTTNYTYTRPYDDGNWNSKNESKYFSDGWYTSSDTKFTFNRTFDVKKANGSDTLRTQNALTSMQNFNTLTSFNTTSVGMGINLFNTGLLNFLSQDGVVNNNQNDAWFNMLFGNLDHHASSKDEQNKQLFEFLYNYKNLLNVGNYANKFGESTIKFKYASKLFGPGPLVGFNGTSLSPWLDFCSNYSLEQNSDWYASSNAIKNWTINGTSWTGGDLNLLQKDASDNLFLNPRFMTNNQTDSSQLSKISSLGAYVSFSDYYQDTAKYNYDQDPKINDKFFPASIGASETSIGIPFLIRPTSTTFSYFDPTKARGFQQNDYLKDVKLKDIQDQVAKTNAWNTFSNHVGSGYEKEKWVEHTKWNVATHSEQPSGTPTFYSLPTSANNAFTKIDDSVTDNTQKADYLDPAIENIFNSNTSSVPTSLQPNDYIGFAIYSFIPFPKSCANTDNPNDLHYDYIPTFQGIQASSSGTPAIFPISMLFNAPTNVDATTALGLDNLDTSLFKSQMVPEANAIYNYKDYDKDKGYTQGNSIFKDDDQKKAFKEDTRNRAYYFDLDKLFEKQQKILTVLDCGQIPSNLNPNDFKQNGFTYRVGNQEYKLTQQDIYNTIYVTKCLFGNWEYTSSWNLQNKNSSNLLNPLD